MRHCESSAAVPRLSLVLALAPSGAGAGVVRLQGSQRIFEAGSGEANDVTLEPRGSLLDRGSGQLVPGVVVRDAGADLTARPGCRLLSGGALCGGPIPAQASFRLRNDDDEIHGGRDDDRLTGGGGDPDDVSCGLGRDRVLPDRHDHVSRCEVEIAGNQIP